MLILCKKLSEGDLRRIETFRSFDRLYAKIYKIASPSLFISQRSVPLSLFNPVQDSRPSTFHTICGPNITSLSNGRN